MTETKNRALFLDRDGVINRHSGYTFTVESFVFIDGIFELCRAAKKAGFLLIVITNQAGIGRGYFTEQDFLGLTEWMQHRFEDNGTPLTDVYYCPCHPIFGKGKYKVDSYNRKPNPGMLLCAAEKHNIDLLNSIFIGDSETDMQAASNGGVGIRCHYISDKSERNTSSSATHEIHSLQEAKLYFE